MARGLSISEEALATGVMFVAASQNQKLGARGAVATTFVAQDSCPTTCPLLHAGCYAESNRTGMFTRRLNAGGPHDPNRLAQREADLVRSAAADRPLRLHVVGDTKTLKGVQIVADACEEYTGRHGEPVWTYTHVHHIPRAAWRRVAVLRSCHTKKQVARAHKDGYAAAIVVPRFPEGDRAWKEKIGDETFTFLPCPEQTKGKTCSTCRLCWDDRRLHASKTVIAFAIHSLPGLHLLKDREEAERRVDAAAARIGVEEEEEIDLSA